jgi:arginine utilization protein RocB
MRDLKPTYNVETAGDAFVYANWLTLTITPESAMQKMKDVALEALDAVSNMIDASFEDFVALGGQSQPPPTRTGQVLDYQTLFQEAKSKWEALNANGDFPSWLAANISDFAASASDSRELSRLLVAELARLAQLSGPAIVTFFSPPFYPSVPTQENALTQAVKSALEESGEAIQFRPFYPYISDLSYVQLKDGVQIDSLKRNMPLFDAKDAHGELIYPLGSEKLNRIRELNCPVVNIGPFGRDAHGLYERVHAPYSFEVVPQIIFDTIWKVLM